VKSSYSGDDGGQCVDVVFTGGSVVIRDTKSPAGPVVRVSPRDWRTFIMKIKEGGCDL
jgi:hypothetical protein